jgi:hypothetical protein
MTDAAMEAEGENSSLEGLYVIGANLHPDAAGPQLYTVLLMHEDARNGRDRPLTDADGYIVWFPQPAFASRALALGDAAFRKHQMLPEVDATFDFAAVFWTIAQGQGEISSEILDALNLLLDLVEATAFPLPAGYRRDLFALADHLTFSADLDDFLAEGADVRVRLMDAITWCIGAVTIKSRIVGGS